MSHTTIYRDTFENMLLVTIAGNMRRDTRNNAIISERILHENQQWEYSASYDVEEKTYVVFVKHEHVLSLPGNSIPHCQICGIELTNSGKLPIYC